MKAADTRVLWAGVGSGGCRTLAALRATLPDTPDLAMIHSSPLNVGGDTVHHVCRLPVGPAGTGGEPSAGAAAAEAAREDLLGLFAGYQWVVLLAGLGGGTATGAAPIAAQLARESGAFVLSFATLPFLFEGARRRQNAAQGLQRLRAASDAVVVFPNERLCEWLPDGTPIVETFRAIDRFVGGSLRTLWRLLTLPTLMPFDIGVLRRMAADGAATLVMACAEATGPDRARTVLAELLESPMIAAGAVLAAAQRLFIGVAGGPDLTITEIQRIAQTLQEHARSDAAFDIAAIADEADEGRLSVTLLLAEHDAADAPPPPPPDAPPKKKAEGRSRARPVQPELGLNASADARFRDVTPTVFEGVDFDVPTFIRRGIRLSRPPPPT